MDKAALRLASGGTRTGDIATHVLIPGLPGFDEAGGKTYDRYPSPHHAGDVPRARALMQEAGYPNGMYDGPPVLLAGGHDSIAVRQADVVEASLTKIGIQVERRAFDNHTLFSPGT